ncbi:HEXXH motif-containing putative peptide modification protein [Streptomyces sp. SID12501]|uniref:HEXXH motif domain-containing protein n=1 Tax=Streptomyces sp. SID12501 TaxID=2706042 RepID=A0A6B3BPJ8_9ACTN|nr:HEXXH motif-containing putative peptide modification protein [Streptomyces sp. SID12501]NEC86240.1 hypothetical protein [Streptomyces sp. SID12501]
MLHLFGVEENLKTVTALAYPFLGRNQAVTPASLKQAYREFLNTVQPSVPSETADEPCYVQRTSRVMEYLDVFSADSSLTDTRYRFGEVVTDSPLIAEDAQNSLDWVKSSASSLAQRHEAFAAVYPIAVNAVFQAPSGMAGGGTTSGAIGVLWVDPRMSWEDRDLEEFLIHELGHTLLFLDECRFGLFTSYPELLKQDNWVTSAIRKTVRPLDKAYHSAVVATEVLLAREEFLGHPSSAVLHPLSPQLAQGALRSIQDIDRPPTKDLLTSHALEILHHCRDEVERLARKNGWKTADFAQV